MSSCTSLTTIGKQAFSINQISDIHLIGCTNLQRIEGWAFNFNPPLKGFVLPEIIYEERDYNVWKDGNDNSYVSETDMVTDFSTFYTPFTYRYESTCEFGPIGKRPPKAEEEQVVVTVTSLALPISPERLITYYPFDELDGTDVIRDRSGFGNNAIISSNGAYLEQSMGCDPTNAYIVFDGDSGYVKLNDNIRPYGDITVSMWVWWEPKEISNDIMILFHNDRMDYFPERGIGFHIIPEGKLQLWFGDGKGSNRCSYRQKTTLENVLVPHKWQHISATFSLHTGLKDKDMVFPDGCFKQNCMPNDCQCNQGGSGEQIGDGCAWDETCPCLESMKDCLVLQDDIQVYIDGNRQSLGEKWEGCGAMLSYYFDVQGEEGAGGYLGLRNKYLYEEYNNHYFKGKMGDLLIFNRILSEEEIQRLATPQCQMDTVTICSGECYEGNCETGIYYYKNKCEKDSLHLQLNVLPPLEDILDTTICIGDCIEINGTQYCSSTNATEDFTSIGKYGCDSTVHINLKIEDCNKQPTTGFTPNGDSFNDYFVIPSLQIRPNDYPNNELIVYNANGQIVYQARPYGNDWDGRDMDGKELPEGSYGYVYHPNNGEEPIKGMVSIHR